MSGIYISDGSNWPEKIQFVQSFAYIKNFSCKWSLR